MLTVNNLESLIHECTLLYEYAQDIQQTLGIIMNSSSATACNSDGNVQNECLAELKSSIRNCDVRSQRITELIESLKES